LKFEDAQIMPNGSHTDFKTGKKSGVGFNHVSPASCQWVSFKNQEEKQKEKANKGEE